MNCFLYCFIYSEVVMTSAHKYYLGPLSSVDRIENGFYDPGHQRENEQLAPLETLAALPLNNEVCLV
jgi:hypothetical protein